MIRRLFLQMLGAGVLTPEIKPTFGTTILSVSVFGGQGSTHNIDTGLRYNGRKVSPTWVGITPAGYLNKAEVGVNPHTADTNIDVQISNGDPWVGIAMYIQ